MATAERRPVGIGSRPAFLPRLNSAIALNPDRPGVRPRRRQMNAASHEHRLMRHHGRPKSDRPEDGAAAMRFGPVPFDKGSPKRRAAL